MWSFGLFKPLLILGAVARGLSPMSEALQQKAMTFSLNKRQVGSFSTI